MKEVAAKHHLKAHKQVRDYLWGKIRSQLDAAGRLSWLVPDQAVRKRQHIQIAKQLRILRRAA